MGIRKVFYMKNLCDPEGLKLLNAIKGNIPLKKKHFSENIFKKGKQAFAKKTRKHY